MERDVAVVLSGGAVNGVLMELGFLKRLRETDLWPRVGWIYGTSAGALSGTMAALDRLDDLEEFMLRLQPEDTFRPHSLWRLPLLGSHDYRLPETVNERLGDMTQIARERADSPDDGSRDDGAGGAGSGRGQCARAAATGRRPDRDRRRMGAELPARPRVPTA